MSEFNFLQQKIIDSLQKKKVGTTCPSCGQNEWAIIDQVVSVQIADINGGVRLPAPFIPSAGLICNSCGFVRVHALLQLGIDLEELKMGFKK
jgi:uncharacterized Zn finger protein